MTLRLVLLGDGESPHLLKWARALSGRVDLWALSSRGFLPGFDEVLPEARRLALGRATRFAGGNAGLLMQLPRVVRWLRAIDADWLAPHYLTSHGTLAWLAVRAGRLRASIASSAWGSDILVTPGRSAAVRWVTRRVLAASALATSDSRHMAERMRALGAGEVMTFPFGLESLPPVHEDGAKEPALFFANRGLEPVYDPGRVLDVFASLAQGWPEARLVVANTGSLREALEIRARQPDLAGRVRFVGRLDADAQDACYARAQWYLSLPRSDSVSVSVLEAMGHGTIPLLSDLPANRELVEDGRQGLILRDGECPGRERLAELAREAAPIGRALRDWVAAHALFPASVEAYVARLQALTPAP